MILSKSHDIIKISKRESKSQEFDKKTLSLIGFDILIYHDIIKISKRESESQEFDKKILSLIGFDILIYHDIIKISCYSQNIKKSHKISSVC